MSLEFDWLSSQNYFPLNPRMPEAQARPLMNAAEQVKDQFRGHLFICSSGTTSKSDQDLKWVALSKEGFLAGAEAANRHLESAPSDVWIHTLPDFHVGGLGIWARAYLSGAKVFRMEKWSPMGLIDSIRNHRGSLVSLVPAQIFDLVQLNLGCPDSLRAVLVGGGALSPSLHQKALSLGWPILTTYGMTEASSQIATLNLKWARGIHEFGENAPDLDILSHLEVTLTDDGRARIRGQSVLSAFVFPGSPAQVIDPKEDGGWYTTQDRVVIQGGRLKMLGRQGDFVKIGGESVELTRLREVLDHIKIRRQLISDLALIPVPDERLGAILYLVSDLSLREVDAISLIQEFNQNVIAFERIREWRKFTRIPRTDLGKLILRECLDVLIL